MPSRLLRAVAATQHVWHALPGCVPLLARFVRHLQGVRSHHRFDTQRSWRTAVEWAYRTRDRRALGVVLELAMVAAVHLLLRVCDAELSGLVVIRHRLV